MNMKVNLAGVELKNPVMTASGTFGSGAEYSEFVDLNKLGAVVTKGVAHVPWSGNDTPRIAEIHSGMMNAIGLQNPGIDVFCERDIPYLQQFDTKVIVNVCGHAPEEYLAVVERLAEEPIDMMEINISCPNVNANFLAFGQDPRHVEELTAQIKKIAKQPVIMKLTPNVTDIAEIARAAEAGGADGVSLINTLTGMKIDVKRRTFALANKTGGVSGPCVKPIAVRNGLSGGPGGKNSYHRHGRYSERRRCAGVYYGRRYSSICGNRQLHQPLCYSGDYRRTGAIYEREWRGRHSGIDWNCEIGKIGQNTRGEGFCPGCFL